VNQQVERLWELQQVMTELGDREKRLSTKPESFAEVDREYQASAAEKTKLTQQVEQLAKERRRVEGELSDQQELQKKYQGQLMQVKNQQQYAAAWKEIDATRKHVKDLEESVLKTMTEIDGFQQQHDARVSSDGDLQTRWNAAHKAWQSSLGDLKKEAAKLRTRAADIEKTLAEPLRREFHRIFTMRQGQAVVKVENDSCTGCRNRVRPQVAQQLKRGDVVKCEACSRILYLEKPSS
jgi:predicted  nucleic acid-binding Zn-ribbon protein